MPIQVGELKLYDVEELAELLHIQERTIRKLLREGKLKARKLARKWYVSEDSLKEYFSQTEPESKRSLQSDSSIEETLIMETKKRQERSIADGSIKDRLEVIVPQPPHSEV